MRRALAAAESALAEAISRDPDDPYNRLEEALLYGAAAFASAKTKDFEHYADLANRKFRALTDVGVVPTRVFLEYAVFCRRTWKYTGGYEAINQYLAREGRRHHVWRVAHIYLELVIGLLREEGETESVPEALRNAAELASETLEAGFERPRLLCAYARILHELGHQEDSAEFFLRGFPAAADYFQGISERRSQLAAIYEEERDHWARAFREAIGDPWVANSLGTFLKECRGDTAGAIAAYDLGLSLARGVDQVAEAILFTNLGLALIESTKGEDLLRAHHALSRARELSRGRYNFAKLALEELKTKPEYQRARAGAGHRQW